MEAVSTWHAGGFPEFLAPFPSLTIFPFFLLGRLKMHAGLWYPGGGEEEEEAKTSCTTRDGPQSCEGSG